MIVDRRRGLYRLPRWVNTLIAIAALVALYFAFVGINHLIAPANFNPCGSLNPNCAEHSTSTTEPVIPATTTPTTAQIVPLPTNPDSNGPQPLFAPAP